MQVRVVADVEGPPLVDDEAASVKSEYPMTEAVMGGLDMETAETQMQTQHEAVASGANGAMETNASSEWLSQATDGGNSAAESGTETPIVVRCPCQVYRDDGLMFKCAVCRCWQHAVCFKILAESDKPARHVCDVCCLTADESTDPELFDVTQSEAQMICLWRRCLNACLEVRNVSVARLESRLTVDRSIASLLIERLLSEGYAYSRSPVAVTKYLRRRKIRKEALAKYFSVASVDVEQ